MPANLSGTLSEDFNSECFTAERRAAQPISIRPAGRGSECQLPVGTEAQSSVQRDHYMYCRPAIVSCKFKVFCIDSDTQMNNIVSRASLRLEILLLVTFELLLLQREVEVRTKYTNNFVSYSGVTFVLFVLGLPSPLCPLTPLAPSHLHSRVISHLKTTER